MRRALYASIASICVGLERALNPLCKTEAAAAIPSPAATTTIRRNRLPRFISSFMLADDRRPIHLCCQVHAPHCRAPASHLVESAGRLDKRCTSANGTIPLTAESAEEAAVI